MKLNNLIDRTIINLKELIQELEDFKTIDTTRMWYDNYGKKSNFDRLRIQSTKDLVKISKEVK